MNRQSGDYMKYFHTIYIALALLLFGCDNPITSDYHSEEYPVIIEKLTDGERQALIEKYRNNNDHDFPCASLNEYGFNDSKICLDREILRVEIMDDEKDRMEKMAAEFLVRNQEFTNVPDKDQLEITDSHGLSGCLKCDGSEGDITTIGWRVTYENQTYEGVNVGNTQLMVFLDSEKVYAVNGHWYRDIDVPSVDQLNHDDARKLLIGREFTFYDWTGEKNYTITEDSFEEYEDKSIFPYETEKGLELRVSLIVEAGIWHLYLDSITGELIHKKQLIIF